jgi:hypothetical protein
MTVFDLPFLACALAGIGGIVRLLYLLVRGKRASALALLRSLTVGAAIYVAVLVAVSAVAPGRVIPLGAPHCFDDFCVTVDSASTTRASGAASIDTNVVVLHGRVSSKARRRQREVDIHGVLIDDRGRRYEVSAQRQRALVDRGEAGSALDAFVEPYGRNRFALTFAVPSNAGSLGFVVAHGWFPGAIIIDGDESLLHRATVVPLAAR